MDENADFQRVLQSLKKTYDRIYVATVGNETYVFRALTRPEYESILQWFFDESDIEEKVCETAVLFPPRIAWKETKAGVTPFLHKEILDASGFHNQMRVRQYISAGRMAAEAFHEQAMMMVVTAFPQYKFEDVEDWPIEKLMKYLGRAEWAHREIYGRKWIELREQEEVDPGAEPKPEPTLNEIAQQMRDEGLDPIMEIGPAEKPPFVDFPLIGGLKVLENEEVLNLVREQVSRVSGRQAMVSGTPEE